MKLLATNRMWDIDRGYYKVSLANLKSVGDKYIKDIFRISSFIWISYLSEIQWRRQERLLRKYGNTGSRGLFYIAHVIYTQVLANNLIFHMIGSDMQYYH